MSGFVDGVEAINALADRSPGFIWRLQTDTGHALDIRPFPDDELKLVTLSTWRDVESLRRFVYRGAHAGYLARRAAWFDEPPSPYLVLWWHEGSAPPTVEEGLARLDHLRRHGPGPHAFDMGHIYHADGTPLVPSRSGGDES